MNNESLKNYNYRNKQVAKRTEHQEAIKKIVNTSYYEKLGDLHQITIDLLEEVETDLVYTDEISDMGATAGAFIYDINILIEVMDAEKCKVDIEVLMALRDCLQNWIDQLEK